MYTKINCLIRIHLHFNQKIEHLKKTVLRDCSQIYELEKNYQNRTAVKFQENENVMNHFVHKMIKYVRTVYSVWRTNCHKRTHFRDILTHMYPNHLNMYLRLDPAY